MKIGGVCIRRDLNSLHLGQAAVGAVIKILRFEDKPTSRVPIRRSVRLQLGLILLC